MHAYLGLGDLPSACLWGDYGAHVGWELESSAVGSLSLEWALEEKEAQTKLLHSAEALADAPRAAEAQTGDDRQSPKVHAPPLNPWPPSFAPGAPRCLDATHAGPCSRCVFCEASRALSRASNIASGARPRPRETSCHTTPWWETWAARTERRSWHAPPLASLCLAAALTRSSAVRPEAPAAALQRVGLPASPRRAGCQLRRGGSHCARAGAASRSNLSGASQGPLFPHCAVLGLLLRHLVRARPLHASRRRAETDCSLTALRGTKEAETAAAGAKACYKATPHERRIDSHAPM
jgi:hypothetical protein